jgi:hypothetical protein
MQSVVTVESLRMFLGIVSFLVLSSCAIRADSAFARSMAMSRTVLQRVFIVQEVEVNNSLALCVIVCARHLLSLIKINSFCGQSYTRNHRP